MLCLPCLAPLALMAATGTAAGGHTSKNDKVRIALYWTTVSILITVIIILVYYIFFKKCDTCLRG